MRVTFDSNAWEEIFSSGDQTYVPIREALKSGRVFGFICEAAFNIEAIRKVKRRGYFDSPKTETKIEKVVPSTDGTIEMRSSFGTSHEQHFGLDERQKKKLEIALRHNIRIMRMTTWLGLSCPILEHYASFVSDSDEQLDERDQCRADLQYELNQRNLGQTAFRNLGGWSTKGISLEDDKKFSKACAEWADGELVIAHICYKNDILCTNDHANSAGQSVFDSDNRRWLEGSYGVRFKSLQELLEKCK